MTYRSSLRSFLVFVAGGIIFASQCVMAQTEIPLTFVPGQNIRCTGYVGERTIIHVGIRNSGTKSIRIWAATLESPSPQSFSLASDISELKVRFEPGEHVLLAVQFYPVAEGRQSATLRIHYFLSEMDSLEISFDCHAFTRDRALLHLYPRIWQPPTTLVGDFSGTLIQLENGGLVGKQATSIEIIGPDSADFHFASNPELHVPASSRTDVELRCASNEPGTVLAAVRITYDDSLTDHALLEVTHLARRAILAAGRNLSFLPVMLGEQRSLSAWLQNTGTIPLVIDRHEVLGAAASDYSQNYSDPFSIEPGGSATIRVQFAPLALGPRDAVLRLWSNDGVEPVYDIALIGEGRQNTRPNIVLGAASVDFRGITYVDSTATEELTVRNTGLSPLRVGKIRNEWCGEPYTAACELTFLPAPPFTVNALDSVSLQIIFAPKAGYSGASRVTVQSDDPLHPEVCFGVNGHSIYAPDLMISPYSLVFPVAIPGDSLDARLTIWNSGRSSSALLVYADTIIGISVRYMQNGPGSRAAFLRLTTNDPAWLICDVPLIGYVSGTSSGNSMQPPRMWILNHFPNPASTHISVSWTAPDGGPYTMLLRDSRGGLIRVFHIDGGSSGKYTQVLDVSDLPQGIYFYSVVGKNHTATRAITVLR